MKYSVRGFIPVGDGSDIVDVINDYVLWRLVTDVFVEESGSHLFTFEAWINSEVDKTQLFESLKSFVDLHGGSIDWHECTHDESESRPCVISEVYKEG